MFHVKDHFPRKLFAVHPPQPALSFFTLITMLTLVLWVLTLTAR